MIFCCLLPKLLLLLCHADVVFAMMPRHAMMPLLLWRQLFHSAYALRAFSAMPAPLFTPAMLLLLRCLIIITPAYTLLCRAAMPAQYTSLLICCYAILMLSLYVTLPPLAALICFTPVSLFAFIHCRHFARRDYCRVALCCCYVRARYVETLSLSSAARVAAACYGVSAARYALFFRFAYFDGTPAIATPRHGHHTAFTRSAGATHISRWLWRLRHHSPTRPPPPRADI